jgi:hypothetical protein
MPRIACWLSCACASALLVPALARAQDSPPAFSYASYFECDPTREARVDTLIRQAFFPILERHLAAKRLTGWGWLARSFGGHWHRAGFVVASSRDSVMDAQSAIIKDLQAQGKALAEFFSICARYEDYIWRRVGSSPPRAPDATRSVSRVGAYFECAVARESRADTLFMQAFAPIYNRHIRTGGLNSWGWHEHVMGGKYRRLLLLDGGNHKAVLASLDSILAEIARQRTAEGKEFGEICYSHQDYLWEIRTPRR